MNVCTISYSCILFVNRGKFYTDQLLVMAVAGMGGLPIELLNGHQYQEGSNAEPQPGEHATDIGIPADVRGIPPRLKSKNRQTDRHPSQLVTKT